MTLILTAVNYLHSIWERDPSNWFLFQAIAPRPMNKKCLADKIILWNHSGGVGFIIIGQPGLSPHSGIGTEGTVIAAGKKFILSQDHRMITRSPLYAVVFIARQIVDVPIQTDMRQSQFTAAQYLNLWRDLPVGSHRIDIGSQVIDKFG